MPGGSSPCPASRSNYRPRSLAAPIALQLHDNLLMLLPPRNSIFIPASELHIFTYAHSEMILDFTYRGWTLFRNSKFSNPASRRAIMPAAFCGGFLQKKRGILPGGRSTPLADRKVHEAFVNFSEMWSVLTSMSGLVRGRLFHITGPSRASTR